ncbi:MAG: M48 family metalloprotease [Acidobacteriia bacterium]|nr:M48 family metalloprotease [Terriglobia bacterium]
MDGNRVQPNILSAILNRRMLRSLALLLAAMASVCVPASAEISEADRALAQQVFQQLLAAAPPMQQIPWPPTLELVDKDEINAYASITRHEGKEQPVVVCYNGLLKRAVEGNADRLAYVLGHELSHHLLGHTKKPAGDTEFLRATFSREQELAADRRGMELALHAGYSFRGGLSAIRRVIDLGLNYSSFEGLAADHPSWFDRIAQLDKEQAGLWRSMSSFDNGVYFLLVQNYPLAERAFRQVTKDFPGSYEAWANLGYALLMQYADALDTEDLRRFDVGQIVAGGFYRRPKSLEGKVRGINEEVWWDAVGALREAIRLQPELSLPRGNLGIAYLLRPAGKDLGKAAQLLEEAAQLAAKDTSLDPVSRLAGQINLAVAYAAQGSTEKAMNALSQVETSLKQQDSHSLRGSAAVSNALVYNRAFLLAQSPDSQRQRLAMDELENYLRHTGRSLAWWPLAYQRYAALCKNSGAAPKTETALLAQSDVRFRPVAALEVSKVQVALGEGLTEAKGQLGAASASTPVVRGTNLVLLEYPNQGIKVMGTDEVLAIVLSGDHAPALPIREMGLGAKSAELKIGMTSAELDQMLGDSDYDFRQLVDPELNYRFYPDLGVAVLTKSGKVIELVIGQVPKRKAGI